MHENKTVNVEDMAENKSPRIPIDTCDGLFEKLKWDYQQLERGWGVYQTFNFVVTAYHLYEDWIKSTGSRLQKQRKHKLPEQGKKLFCTLRDITNASKHWQLNTKSQAIKVVSNVSSPEIGDWYAYFVAGPVMYVSVGDSKPSVPELAGTTLECLDWILNGPDNSFPATLKVQLDYIFQPPVVQNGG
jgi:hypothetical protein